MNSKWKELNDIQNPTEEFFIFFFKKRVYFQRVYNIQKNEKRVPPPLDWA